MPTHDDFVTFYQSFIAAIQNGDESALRGVLPADIEDDHFAFLWEINQALAAETTPPEISVSGNQAVVTYTQESEDGADADEEEVMDCEFWFHEGKWLCYDPNEE